MPRSRPAPRSARPRAPRSLAGARRAAASCIACDLYRRATQTVFGEGPTPARVLMVGEQPGHEEDLAGRPFVGPAGRLLDRVLAAAGLDRSQLYLTNAVKHFKWEPRGKRRIHARPNGAEVGACRRWFDAEVALVAPDIIVCLGATAAQALLGRAFKVSVERGRLLPTPLARGILATVHPSAVLRAPDSAARDTEMRRLTADLRRVAQWLRRNGASRTPGGLSRPPAASGPRA